jgi:hypothetical protein
MAKKATLTAVATGFGSAATLDANFTALNTALDNTLSLDGSTPNAMTADLDMNGQGINNCDSLLIDGTDVFAVINKVTISTSAPSGGSDKDIWFKVSS